MEALSKLLIKKMILIGHRKNYEIPFFPGVNIIYGEEDSGKSSILELINYLLGSSKLDKYIELEQSVKYAILEVNLNDVTYCIKRDIFDHKREIEVFISTYENIDTVFPQKYKPYYDNSLSAEFFSDFLLNALNYPKIKIKTSPTKDDSSLARLSFRELFKFCYINQDNVGSKNFLINQDHSRYQKVKEVFKYIFNLNDEEISSLQQSISEKTIEKNKLNTKSLYIKDFLETIEIESLDYITLFLEDINTNLIQIDKTIQELNVSITSNSKEYEPLKEYLQTLNYWIQDKEKQRKVITQNIKRYDRLINDYYDDKLKFESILSAKKLIGIENPEITICPLCEHDVDTKKFIDMYEIHDKSKLDTEIKNLIKRIRDLKELSDTEKESFRKNEKDMNELISMRDEIRTRIDEELEEHISPYLTKRDEIIKEKALLLEREQQIVKALKIRNEQQNIDKKIKKLEEDINQTRLKLEERIANQPELSNVLSELKIILSTYLYSIGVKNCTDIDVNTRSYLPMLRHKEYSEITSGGIRTVMSIGFLLNILEYSLNNNTNLPRFLMIDTVGKYLQKTKNKYLTDTDESEDIKEEIHSAGKYKNLYEYIINLSIKMEEANKSCQIILVDNDVPTFIEEEYKGFIIRKFSKDPQDNLPIGLIDDYSEDMY